MNLTATPFLLFGMGTRRKLLYAPPGRLLDALTLEPIRTWEVVAARIAAAEYCVALDLRNGSQVRIMEDEEAVWLEQGHAREALTSGQHVHLPRFEAYPQAGQLRALHAELLVNLMPCGPVPNLWVYPRPWYRDAAMMLMCLNATGNLHLVEQWVAGLHKVWDRNNAGEPEADNLGQVLYMISLFNNRKHPLIEKVLKAIPAYHHDGHIRGRTDYAEHPVYQTKWLKFGLKHLQLDDSYSIPVVADSYSSLFWMDYRDQHVPISVNLRSANAADLEAITLVAGQQDVASSCCVCRRSGFQPLVPLNAAGCRVYVERQTHACAYNPLKLTPMQNVPHARLSEKTVQLYPYLGWAEAHFYNDAPPRMPAPGHQSFLTWEGKGSEADYWRLRPLIGMGVLPGQCLAEWVCTPHTWHAAEMFLYYMACQHTATPDSHC